MRNMGEVFGIVDQGCAVRYSGCDFGSEIVFPFSTRRSVRRGHLVDPSSNRRSALLFLFGLLLLLRVSYRVLLYLASTLR